MKRIWPHPGQTLWRHIPHLHPSRWDIGGVVGDYLKRRISAPVVKGRTMSRDTVMGILIGTLVSIPVGLLTGLLLSPTQRGLRTLGSKAIRTRRQWREQQYEEVLYYVENPVKFAQRLIKDAILMMLGATAILYVVLPVLIGSFIAINYPAHENKGAHHFIVDTIVLILANIVGVTGTICLMAGPKAFALYRRVNEPLKYFESVPFEIRNEQAGKSAMIEGQQNS